VLIALLAVLGVNLWVIVVLLAVVLTRKRQVSHQPGAFKGAIRVMKAMCRG
jgi:cell division protein FtsB